MQYKPKKPPKPLFFENQTEPVAWACGTCGRVLPKDTVRTCCATKVCDCGVEYESHYTLCFECHCKKEAAKLQAKIDKAEKLETYDGPVYCENLDTYYPDFGTAWDDIRDGDIVWDDKATRDQELTFWACTIKKFNLDSGDIIIRACEGLSEECDVNDISDAGNAELQEILDGWVETYASHIETWYQDESRMLVIHPDYWKDYDEEWAKIREEDDAKQ